MTSAEPARHALLHLPSAATHCCQPAGQACGLVQAVCVPLLPPVLLSRPKFIEISPYYPPEGAPATNPAVIAAMNILQSMYLPKGIDDAGMTAGGRLAVVPNDMAMRMHVCTHVLQISKLSVATQCRPVQALATSYSAAAVKVRSPRQAA